MAGKRVTFAICHLAKKLVMCAVRLFGNVSVRESAERKVILPLSHKSFSTLDILEIVMFSARLCDDSLSLTFSKIHFE